MLDACSSLQPSKRVNFRLIGSYSMEIYLLEDGEEQAAQLDL